MNHEIPKNNIESQENKTAEQIFAEVIGESGEDFIQKVLEELPSALQKKKNFIYNKAIRSMPGTPNIKEKYNVEGQEMTILEILSLLIDRYLEQE